jgi:two-component system, chemotaxis family, response regulator Rcp1
VINILLAEDNPADVFFVKFVLEKQHIPHELHVVSDGEQALAYMNRMGKPGHPGCADLLLLDLNLPRMKGQKVLSAFRKRGQFKSMTVIVVTSSEGPRERIRMAELGIDGYFLKPKRLAACMELADLVRNGIKEKVQRTTVSATA